MRTKGKSLEQKAHSPYQETWGVVDCRTNECQLETDSKDIHQKINSGVPDDGRCFFDGLFFSNSPVTM